MNRSLHVWILAKAILILALPFLLVACGDTSDPAAEAPVPKKKEVAGPPPQEQDASGSADVEESIDVEQAEIVPPAPKVEPKPPKAPRNEPREQTPPKKQLEVEDKVVPVPIDEGESVQSIVQAYLQTVSLEEATRPLLFEILPEYGYENADGEFVLDVMEGDSIYMTLMIRDSENRPVQGAVPKVTPQRDSHFRHYTGEPTVSNNLGSFEFWLMGGSMGEDRVEIAVGETTKSVILNVISAAGSGFGSISDLEGVIHWDQLKKAEVKWGEDRIHVTFPSDILEKSGETVKLTGFMMPLGVTPEQDHFVLASHPPGCFFHTPGGPAGAVEVFADPPVEVTWNLLVLEGRFEALESSEEDVVYRLHDARLVERTSSEP